jgi:hypothetical protein
MLVEGIGQKAPQRIPIVLTEDELRVLFLSAKERAEYRCYQNRGDAWGRGCKEPLDIMGLGTLSQAERPIFVGLLGEYAMKRFVTARFPGSCEIDLDLRASGDFGIDLKPFGLSIDVKTRQTNAGPQLVKVVDGRGRATPPKAMVLAICMWEGFSTVNIVGWNWTADLLDGKELVEARGGRDWLNIEVEDTDLLPACRMRDVLESWKAAKQWH